MTTFSITADEVLRNVGISDIIKVFGADALLEEIGQYDAEQYFKLIPEE